MPAGLCFLSGTLYPLEPHIQPNGELEAWCLTACILWTDMLRQMADLPRMEAMVRSPNLLSYHIASNMPLQDATRQELLEVDGTVHRLRREIELLETMDQLRCKCCFVCTPWHISVCVFCI